MERTEIIALAKRAQTDLKVARGAFRKLALAEGFTGAAGGWIYRNGVQMATAPGWQGLADLVARGSVRFTRAEAGETPAPAPAKVPAAKPLSPAMRRLVCALGEYGYIDPIRDCGRMAGGGRIGVNTIVALMDRGIIREAKRRHGVHFPATTPEQVWDEAHAEDRRRDDEQAAYLADNTTWVQCTPDGDLDAHTRQTRDGRTILIVERSFRYWLVYFGDDTQCSAGGTWQEARRAADRFERNQAHGEALAEYPQPAQTPPIAVGDTVVRIGEEGPDSPRGKVLEIETYSIGQQAQVSWSGLAPAGIALHRIRRADPIVESVAGLSVCPAGHVAPKTDGDTCTDCEQPEGWSQPDGMLGATEAEARHSVAAIDGMAQAMAAKVIAMRAERAPIVAALVDVAALREVVGQLGGTIRERVEWRERLDRIEVALKASL